MTDREAPPRGRSVILAVALVALGAAACSAGSSDAGPSTGTGGGPPDAGASCTVTINDVQPPPAGGLTAGDGKKLRLQGAELATAGAAYDWSWTVTYADGSNVPVTIVDDSHRLIEFSLLRPGTYTVDVQLVGSVYCSNERNIQVPAPGTPRLASFRFRFVPPANGPPAQEQELQVSGGAPFRGDPIRLSSGTIVRFDPRDPMGKTTVPSYVRINEHISDNTTGRLVAEAHTPAMASSPPVELRLVPGTYGTFDMLIVPDTSLNPVAPVLLKGKTPAELQAAMPIMLSAGTPISGTVVDGAGVPLVGARVALHAGPVPSTLDHTDSAGHFTVYASPGTYGMTITQTMGQGILEATLGANPGVPVDASTGAAPPPALAVAIKAPMASASVGLRVTASQAASLAAGSKVVVQTATTLLGVATVSIGGGTALSAPVRIRSELAPQVSSSDPRQATVSIGSLPAAHYRATVFPAAADGTDAITGTDLDLSGAAPPSPVPVTLDPKVTLGGQLVSTGATDGVQVTALDISGDFPVALAGQSAGGGLFKIAVSPDRMYRLRAQPAAGQLLARALFGPVTVGEAGATLAPQTMQSGLLYSGIVADANAGLTDTLIQVFCLKSTPGCTDEETPIAETVSGAKGFFRLTLPDPGVDP